MSIRQGITDSQINTRIPIYFTRNHRFGCKALPTEHKNWSTSDWCQITVMFITVYLSVSLFFFLFFFSPLFFSLTHHISLPPFFPSPTFLSLPFFPSASQDMEMPVGEDSHFVIKVVSMGMAVLWVRAFLSLYTLCHLFRDNSRCDRQFDLTTIICCETLSLSFSLACSLLTGFFVDMGRYNKELLC